MPGTADRPIDQSPISVCGTTVSPGGRVTGPELNPRARGWLRFLWRKATTTDDWSASGEPHAWWDRYSSEPVLNFARFDLSESAYAVAVMADVTQHSGGHPRRRGSVPGLPGNRTGPPDPVAIPGRRRARRTARRLVRRQLRDLRLYQAVAAVQPVFGSAARACSPAPPIRGTRDERRATDPLRFPSLGVSRKLLRRSPR